MDSNTSKTKHPTPYERQTGSGARLPSITPAMDSKTSTMERLIPVETRTIIPRVPQEIADEILDHLRAGSDSTTLQACAIVSKSWALSSRRHLFHTILFTSRGMGRWLKTFPVPEESPAHHTRRLRVRIVGDRHGVPEEFFQYTRWFTNAKELTLLGFGVFPPLRTPSLWKLPQSITSLTVRTDVLTPTQIRDIMEQLPNLDDLSLSGSHNPVDRSALPGIGTTSKGRFGGRLLLRNECPYNDVVDMLLGIPSKLQFTEVDICCPEYLLSTVRLAEACGSALVKLSYTITLHRKSYSSRSSWLVHAN